MFTPHLPTATTAELVDALKLRIYALSEQSLRELLDYLEAEYVSRQAANAGYVECADQVF